MKRTIFFTGLLFCWFSQSPGFAQEPPNTIKKIKDSGVISLGHRESSIPFSYYDENQKVVGYSQDLMMKVVNIIKDELKLGALTVKLTPVTAQNRITLIQNGSVDLECGSTTNNVERQKQVAFSNTFFIIGTRLLTKKDSGIQDFSDLVGKTVATTAGTTSDRILREMNTAKNMNINITSAKDHGEAFREVESGRAVAFMMDDALLYGEIAKSKRPSEWAVVGAAQSYEAYGCILRKDDSQFKQLVDSALSKIMGSPEIQTIYAKWFMSPIPPKGTNLNFPMSPELAATLKNPNDKSLEGSSGAEIRSITARVAPSKPSAPPVATASNVVPSATPPASASNSDSKSASKGGVSIEFSPKSVALSTEGEQSIANVVERAKEAKNIIATGYCDKQQADNAKDCALARARAVKAQLVKAGIAAEKIRLRYNTEHARNAVVLKFS